MPMPYGSRGGMAFGADELRVLRRALAHALQTTSPAVPLDAHGPDRSQDVQEYRRLAEAVDEAVREGARLRAILLADLARQGGPPARAPTAAPPGTPPGAAQARATPPGAAARPAHPDPR